MTSVLRWKLDDALLDGQKNRKSIENFIFNQLSAILEDSDHGYELYRYCDCESYEIDFIIENEDGDLIGIKVKASSAVSQETSKYLICFKENITKKDLLASRPTPTKKFYRLKSTCGPRRWVSCAVKQFPQRIMPSII